MITFNEKSKTFLLHAGSMTQALRVVEGNLLSLWYGPRMEREGDLPGVFETWQRCRIGSAAKQESLAEYPGWSGELFGGEPALKVTFPDGTRDLLLRYDSHKIDGEGMAITLKDKDFPFYAHIRYRVLEDVSVIERAVTLENRCAGDVRLEQFMSGAVRLPNRDAWRLTTLTGKWGDEYRITRDFVRDGQSVLQTRGIWSGADAVPFAAFDEGDADERGGGVWYASLLWSGTHRVVIERTPTGMVNALLGINPFDCKITLHPGEAYTLPTLMCGYTDEGFGGMSRDIHAYERRHVMAPGEAERILPVVCNAYGTYFGNINEEKIMALIEPAHRLGIEALIIDAGWAGEGDNYQLGMGTWNENKERFPHGLRAISDALHARGMLFGLWMEPEIVHQHSPLYKAHPDWVFGYPGREPDVGNNFRMCLNLALDEVREYLTGCIVRLIETCGVDYFKIDYNRRLWEADSTAVPDCDRQSLWAKYVENLWGMYADIKARYPKLLFENCAGGGMRTDIAMLRFSGRINRSDNQDPLDILTLHEGFSYFMLPKLAGGGCHISDVYTHHMNHRTSPMRFQAHAAMMGSMAIGKNLAEITPEEAGELRGYIEMHKRLRRTVQLGDIYRLASLREKEYAAFEYLSPEKDEAVLFVFGRCIQFARIYENIRLDGLDEDALYEVEGVGVKSGRALMRIGLRFVLEGDMDSRVVVIKKIKK